MSRLRRQRLNSLRNKLALLFFAITAAAFSVIYFYVVPQSESNLRRERLDLFRGQGIRGREEKEDGGDREAGDGLLGGVLPPAKLAWCRH